ncbi:MAG: hypothetical protein HY22_07665 [[Candidatus Thermochlorobacteriaceae] bacterium GBChlB]|nr:MAG: hypothetical protein HY22_07665 [[Candidatus Thermochlorobacteriaceae] bacterium GBChlB]
MSVYHAGADAPTVNITVDGQVAINNLTFSNGVSAEVQAGARQLGVQVSGLTILQSSLNAVAGQNYSVFAVDTIGTGVAPGRLSLLVTTDNLSSPPSGQAAIRFLHLSPDAPAVDFVTFTGGTAALPTGVQPISGFSNVSSVSGRGAANPSAPNGGNFVTIPAGARVGVRLAGSTGSLIAEFALPGQGATAGVAAGKIYTATVQGFLTPPARVGSLTPARTLQTVTYANN